MDSNSIQNTVYYCCIVKEKEGEIMYTYSNGDYEIESLAALCLEKMMPPFHKWYFQTMNHRIFGFLLEDSFVYFAISDECIGNSGVYKFLELVMDEFSRLRRNTTSINNALALQEQFMPVFHRLIMSLDETTPTTTTTVCMEIPLLGMSGKYDKKKSDKKIEERVEVVTDRGEGSGREAVCLTGSEIARKKWYREIRIVIAIDVGVCLVLFAVWMIICNGIKCIR